MKIYWIEELPKGHLGMMGRPKGGDWLNEEIHKLKTMGVSTLVSLLVPGEIRELALSNELEYCHEHGIKLINFPIPDRGLPDSKIEFKALVDRLDESLKAAHRVVIHCRMGIGRTAMLCAALLLRQGYDAGHVFGVLAKYRGVSVPDTNAQLEWVLSNFSD